MSTVTNNHLWVNKSVRCTHTFKQLINDSTCGCSWQLITCTCFVYTTVYLCVCVCTCTACSHSAFSAMLTSGLSEGGESLEVVDDETDMSDLVSCI